MPSKILFPNYMQMHQRIPMPLWHGARLLSVGVALGLCITLLVRPELGLYLFWRVLIPMAPALFFIAPGVWRNICPMAALNQTPRLFEFTRGQTLPNWLKEYGYVIGIALFVVIASSRKTLFNYSGAALALLIFAVLAAAFVMGFLYKGKSGWCSSICPLLPVQRIYGQTPFVTVPNSHCQPCVGCTKNCYDFNPPVAYLADLYDDDHHFAAYRKLFVGLFPGFIWAFYTLPNPPEIAAGRMYLLFAVYSAVSLGLFFGIEAFAKVTANKITVLFGAVALNLYYWFNAPVLGELIATPAPVWFIWAWRTAILGLTLLWIYRTWQKEARFVAQTLAPPLTQVGESNSLVSFQASLVGNPEVSVQPEGKRIVARKGVTLLELIESNGLPIEAGCRMGVCGADPICVLDGMRNLSKVGNDERMTLERLGLAENTRMACMARVRGHCTIALTPEKPDIFRTSMIRNAKYDKSVEKIVVIGNGIAGVTAADHIRRRHPTCEIHLVGRERHHLYNRMAITRLIYGRSAMQGLYLLPEKWYDDFNITCWLNTRATRIDTDAQTVTLGTGETLPYDRLILTTGSEAFVPPIAGAEPEGVFVLRTAEDAMSIRDFVQERVCQQAVVAGGGLLGLEAAYGLHKLGLNVAVLERSDALLRRQLDARSGQLLQSYLEGMGIQIVTEAETAALQHQRGNGAAGGGRVQQVSLKDGRRLPCDLFLICAGIRSNLELAKEIGLKVNRGILVDEYMRTSQPNIFAAGDVVEYADKVLGLWAVAVSQSEVAAASAVAPNGQGDKEYDEIVPVTMLKVVGVDLTSIGRFEAKATETEIVLEEPQAHTYCKLVLADGKIGAPSSWASPPKRPVWPKPCASRWTCARTWMHCAPAIGLFLRPYWNSEDCDARPPKIPTSP
ncbi:MAG: FAD-dependent oxidoreductase [Caldilineaceae bacterium]